MKKSTKTKSGLISEVTTARRASRTAPNDKNVGKPVADAVALGSARPKRAVPENAPVTIDSQTKQSNPGAIQLLPVPTGKAGGIVPDDGTCDDHAYERELEKAKSIGAEQLSGADLLGFCQTAHSYFERIYLKDARPFFVELWRRLKKGPIPGVARTKQEACDKIGCSIRWVQMIIAGTTDYSNNRTANNKQKGGEVTSPPVAATIEKPTHEDLSPNDRADAILSLVWEQMEDLNTKAKWAERQKLCAIMAELLSEAARTGYVDDDSYESPVPSAAGRIQ